MIRDILMFLIFITESHLIQSIGQIISRSSFIIFKGNDWVRLNIGNSDLINSTKSHHGFGIAKISTLYIKINCLLHTGWIITAGEKQGVSFEAIVLCLNKIIVTSINPIVAFHDRCYFSLLFNLCVSVSLVSSFARRIIRDARLHRISLFYIQSSLSLRVMSGMSCSSQSFMFLKMPSEILPSQRFLVGFINFPFKVLKPSVKLHILLLWVLLLKLYMRWGEMLLRKLLSMALGFFSFFLDSDLLILLNVMVLVVLEVH